MNVYNLHLFFHHSSRCLMVKRNVCTILLNGKSVTIISSNDIFTLKGIYYNDDDNDDNDDYDDNNNDDGANYSFIIQ